MEQQPTVNDPQSDMSLPSVQALPVTEVTTIAKEEAKSGEQIMPRMTEEELVSKASSSFFLNRQRFDQLFTNLSVRGKIRVMRAIMDLPADGVPVYLKDNAEKMAFSIGQQVIQSRFIITQFHINQEIKRIKQEQAEKQQQEAQAIQEKTDESATTTDQA